MNLFIRQKIESKFETRLSANDENENRDFRMYLRGLTTIFISVSLSHSSLFVCPQYYVKTGNLNVIIKFCLMLLSKRNTVKNNIIAT